MAQVNDDKWRICRICLLGENKELYSLRLSDEISIKALEDFDDNILTCIEEIGNVKIDLVSNMPDKICKCCVLLLRGAYKFRELCLKSDKRLKEVLQLGKPCSRVLGTYKESVSPGTHNEDECEEFICVEEEEEEEEADLITDKQEVAYQVETLTETVCIDEFENVEEYELIEDFNDLSTEHFNPTPNSEDQFYNEVSSPSDIATFQVEAIDVDQEFYDIQEEESNTPSIDFSNETFKTPPHKKRKMESSAKIVNYVCSYCGNVYSEKSKLTMHLKLHTNEKPHECEIHTNERPYKCKICGKSFAYSNVLKVHMITHTGEKPYRCNFCCKKFAQMHHKNDHERRHKRLLPNSIEYNVDELQE
uniref:Protein krueppel n=1 Tax=Glossina brevipalpis TaxID=37001 RepID=A0A1A9WJ27_9MUSC